MKINEEELKLIIRDLISNRDNDDIREFNEKLYANVDYTLCFKHCMFPKNPEELNRWYNWYNCYR